jgi:hypothetical protein
VLLACAPSTGPTPPHSTSRVANLFPNWPQALNDFRFHWYAAPGIDLTAGPVVAVRAYLESYRIANLTGGDTSAVYPGFTRATPENEPESRQYAPFELRYVRPETRAEAEAKGWKYVERNMFGYGPFYILSLTRVGAVFRAAVCQGEYSTFHPDDADPNKYVSVANWPPQDTDDKGTTVWRVELTDTDPRVGPNPPAAPMNPQLGPLPAPTGDVFGRWFITGASTSLWGVPGEAQYVDTREVKQQCAEHMPDDAAARKAMYTGLHDQPPPHGDPIPGWPTA